MTLDQPENIDQLGGTSKMLNYSGSQTVIMPSGLIMVNTVIMSQGCIIL